MAIGGFGIDPASKFATKLQSLEIWRKALPGAGSYPVGSAGLDFQKGSLRFRFPVVSFQTVQSWQRADHQTLYILFKMSPSRRAHAWCRNCQDSESGDSICE
jgi:hypothetical protein